MKFIALVLAVLCCGVARSGEALITVDVHDADITDVIALLASESGTNIVTDASVRPERVTLHLHNVGFDEALSVLVSAHGLQVRKSGAILIVGAADTMNRRYDAQNATLGPQTASLALARANPDDVAKEITDALPSGTVIVPDKRTSTIVVTGKLGDRRARAISRFRSRRSERRRSRREYDENVSFTVCADG